MCHHMAAGHWRMNSGAEMDVLLIGQYHTLWNQFHLKQIKEAWRSNNEVTYIHVLEPPIKLNIKLSILMYLQQLFV